MSSPGAPSMVQKHAWNSKLALGGECELLSALLCGPAIMWQLIHGPTRPLHRDSWDRLQKIPATSEHMVQRGRKTNIGMSE